MGEIRPIMKRADCGGGGGYSIAWVSNPEGQQVRALVDLDPDDGSPQPRLFYLGAPQSPVPLNDQFVRAYAAVRQSASPLSSDEGAACREIVAERSATRPWQRLLLGLRFSGSRHFSNYVDRLKNRYPNQSAQIQAVVDCFIRTQNAQECLSQNVTGGLLNFRGPVTLSETLQKLASSIVALGETALSENIGLDEYLSRIDLYVFSTDSYRQNVSPQGREDLNDLAMFYAERLRGSFLGSVRRGLLSRPDWAERLRTYDTRSITYPAPLNPPLCPNSNEWERHDLNISGLHYYIPIFLTKGRSLPWAFHAEALRGVFEVLKVFLAPQDLEKLLHPGDGRPDMAFYFGGRRFTSIHGFEGALNRCGIRTDDRGGEYSPERNHIMIDRDPPPMHLQEWQQSRPLGSFSRLFFETFFHEVGHAIDFVLLDPGVRANLESQYQVVRRLATPANMKSSQVTNEMVPGNVYHIGETELTPVAGGWQQLSQEHSGLYALKNSTEFFAEMVTEYILTELANGGSSTGPFQARKKIMRDFFSPTGINPEAFEPSNVETAFRAEGIALDLPRPSPSVPRPFSRPSFLAFDFRATATLTGRGDPGGYFSMGIASLSAYSLGVGGAVFMGLQGFKGPEAAFGGEVFLRTPRFFDSFFSLDIFGRGGMVGKSSGFGDFGGRFQVYTFPRFSSGFYFLLGGSGLVVRGDIEKTTPIFEFGLGFSPQLK